MFEVFKNKNIEIKSVNIKFKGSIHTLNWSAKRFNHKNIIINVPFKNNFNINKFRIEKISVEPPFSIKEINPKTPIDINSGESITIKLNINGPDYSYSGPINLEIS